MLKVPPNYLALWPEPRTEQAGCVLYVVASEMATFLLHL
jgi:hypothetical protein